MYKQFLYSTLAITLSACGGGSSSDAPLTSGTMTGVVNTSENEVSGVTGNSPNVSQFGIVNFGVDDDVVYISASFISIPQQVSLADWEEASFGDTEVDTCEVNTVDFAIGGESPEIPEIPEIPVSNGLEITTLSAGEVLTVSSPAGSYAELLRFQQFGFTLYRIDDDVELSVPVPNNLSISIPGDEFAAFGNIALPAYEPLLVSSPGEFDLITANTSFSWIGSTNPNSFVEISAVATSADFMSLVFLDCEVVDDGSFAFSAATQAELGAFSAIGSLERYALKLEQKGNSVLLLGTESQRVN